MDAVGRAISPQVRPCRYLSRSSWPVLPARQAKLPALTYEQPWWWSLTTTRDRTLANESEAWDRTQAAPTGSLD